MYQTNVSSLTIVYPISVEEKIRRKIILLCFPQFYLQKLINRVSAEKPNKKKEIIIK